MTFKCFDIDPDRVTIDDQLLFRPPYISVMQWMDFWECAKEQRTEDDVNATMSGEIEDLEGTVIELRSEIEALQEEISKLEAELSEK